MEKDLKKIHSRIYQKEDQLLMKTRVVAKDPLVRKLLSENNHESLVQYGQNLMVNQGLSYLLFTDPLGSIFSGPSEIKQSSGNLFTEIPNAKIIFNGGDFKSIERKEDFSLLLISGTAIKDNHSRVIGTVFGGYLINDDFLRNIAIKNELNIFLTDHYNIAAKYSNKKAINRLFFLYGDNLLNESSKIREVKLNNKYYLIASTELNNNEDKVIGRVHAVRQNNLKFCLVIGIISLVSSIFIFTFMTLKKILGKTKQHISKQ